MGRKSEVRIVSLLRKSLKARINKCIQKFGSSICMVEQIHRRRQHIRSRMNKYNITNDEVSESPVLLFDREAIDREEARLANGTPKTLQL